MPRNEEEDQVVQINRRHRNLLVATPVAFDRSHRNTTAVHFPVQVIQGLVRRHRYRLADVRRFPVALRRGRVAIGVRIRRREAWKGRRSDRDLSATTASTIASCSLNGALSVNMASIASS